MLYKCRLKGKHTGRKVCCRPIEASIFLDKIRGGSSVRFLQIGEGAKPVLFAVEGGSHFSARKKVRHVASVKVNSFIC